MTSRLLLLLLAILFSTTAGFAQTASFTFQGKLNDGALPANGTYEFQFKLYDGASGGAQIGSTLSDIPATVTNGIFAVGLDFGAASFDGTARYIEVGVRLNGSGQPYTILNPRQEITSTPYAVKSLNAENAVTAQNASNAGRLGNIPAAQYTKTNDPRLSDDRNPLPNSPNYIQNGTSSQPTSNFSISGEGKANIFSAATQFNIGANRVLSIGNSNLFVGNDTGTVNSSGSSNSFVGAFAGSKNTTGKLNSFFGRNAGFNNDVGIQNSFFGVNSGVSNTSGGDNSFFGMESGYLNVDGWSNSFFGTSAGKSNLNGSFNSFFGRSAGESNTSGGDNAFVGQASGFKNTSGAFNAALGSGAGLNNTTGNGNIFVGQLTGLSNTTENNNIFLGYKANGVAGITNATAIGANSVVTQSNTIVLGTNAVTVQVPGSLNVAGSFSANILNAATQFNLGGNRFLGAAGSNNTFAGLNSGTVNLGNDNSFFGRFSGAANLTGSFNAFFGTNAGAANTTGSDNSFFGQAAGFKNTIGGLNTAVGSGAGLNNTTGNSNTFLGQLSGTSNTTENNNTFLGFAANGAAGITNATAIGANAVVTTSNTMVLGTNAVTVFAPGSFNSATNYKIGGNRAFHLTGTENVFVGVDAGNSITSGGFNVFMGREAGKLTTTGLNNAFFGAYAGRDNNVGGNNAFFGANAGISNVANFNSFFGSLAGFSNLDGAGNSFFGMQSGQNNTSGQNNSFFGLKAGGTTTSGSNNTFIGALTGVAAGFGTSSNNTAVGYNIQFQAGVNNSTGIGANILVNQSNTVKIGDFGDEVVMEGNVYAKNFNTNEFSVNGSDFTAGFAGGGNGFEVHITGKTYLDNISSTGGAEFDAEVRTDTNFRAGGNGYFGGDIYANNITLKDIASGGNNDLCFKLSNPNDQNSFKTIAWCSSSIRYKTNVQNFTRGLDLIRQLRPVTFNWKSDGKADVGFVAEEVNRAEPLLTIYNQQGQIEGVKYAQITTALVNSVKEQQTQIESQKALNQKLQEQIKAQQAQIDELKAVVCIANPGAVICFSTK